MTIGTTHDGTLSRVRVAVSAAPSGADYAVIERSTDGITWTTVRGGEAVPLVAGACALDDFEFSPNVLNTYRTTYVDTAGPSVVAVGTLSSANNASVTPGMPAGVGDGDMLVLVAAIRSTTSSVNIPLNWDLRADLGNFRVFTRPYSAGVTAPTVTFALGVANADTAARITALRNADATPVSTTQFNASAQDIGSPAIAAAGIKPNLLFRSAWKSSPSTNAVQSGWASQFRDSVTAGDDMTIMGFTKATSVDEPAGVFTMTGGSAAVSRSTTLRFSRKEYVSRETSTITPPLTAVWLKNVQRPFLNTAVKVIGFSPIRRPSRSGVHDIIGRSDAVAVTELRSGNRFSLRLELADLAEAEEMDTRLSTGSVMLLHVPVGAPFPGGYYVIDETERSLPPQKHHTQRRYLDLPLIQVAAPAASVVGTTYTWQGVVNDYPTWSAVIAANATWGALLERIGSPADVVVP